MAIHSHPNNSWTMSSTDGGGGGGVEKKISCLRTKRAYHCSSKPLFCLYLYRLSVVTMMIVSAFLIVINCLLIESVSSSSTNLHHHLSSEERAILLGHPTNVPQYEVVSQFNHQAGKTLDYFSLHNRRKRKASSSIELEGKNVVRRKRSTGADTEAEIIRDNPIVNHNKNKEKEEDEIVKVEFYAFKRLFRLRLWPNRRLLSPSFYLTNEIVDRLQSKTNGEKSEFGDKININRTKSEEKRTSTIEEDIDDFLNGQLRQESINQARQLWTANIEDCFYQGKVEGEENSAVAISLCNGMQGVIETKTGVYMINPLPGHTVDRLLGVAPSSLLTATNRSLLTSFDGISSHHYDDNYNLTGATPTTTTDANSTTISYHIVLKNDSDDYECPHPHPHSNLQSSMVDEQHFDWTDHRSKRSIDIVSSDLNFLNDVGKDSSINENDIDYPNIHHHDRHHRNRNNTSSTTISIQPSPTSKPTQTSQPTESFNITVETAVFVDESLYHLLSKTFPVETEQQIVLYVLTIMNAVQLLFKQPSIGRSVDISVVLMDLLKQQPKNLHPSDNIDTYLTNFCVWQHKKRLRESGGPTPDWDHALLLSGINMYVVDGRGRRKRHVVGLAPVSGMCNSLNSCTISEGTSFQTVLVAGHEMGHSLGMEHDGSQDGNNCNKDDFVMSPTLGPGKTTWSDCSRQYLDKFVLTPQATCVLGRSSHVNIIHQFIPHHQLPGERFNVEDQCRFRFGAQARHSAGQPMSEICHVIKCRVKSHIKNGALYSGRSLYQYPSKSTYNTHPALEGTDCGTNKWCREGRCVWKKSEKFPGSSSVNNVTNSLGTDTDRPELNEDLDNYLSTTKQNHYHHHRDRHHRIEDDGELVVVPKIELSRNRHGNAHHNNNNNNNNNRLKKLKKSNKTKSTTAPSGESSSTSTPSTPTISVTVITPSTPTHIVNNSVVGVLGTSDRRPPTTILIKEDSPYRYHYNHHNRFSNDFGRNKNVTTNIKSDNIVETEPSKLDSTSTKESDVNDYLQSSYRKHNPYNDKPSTSTTGSPNNDQNRNGNRWQSSRLSGNSLADLNNPINGNWSNWSEFGPCISECVAPSGQSTPFGVMSSLRRCTNPMPAHGGGDCRGSDTKVKLCSAVHVCSIESAISAASGPGASRSSTSHHHSHNGLNLDSSNSGQRYRIRSVEEYIEDTCGSAAKNNDKIEGHGTQYPSYDSASHSCYVWCHKRGGGFMSQGWRLPDGTPCGQKMHSAATTTNDGSHPDQSSLLSSKTGFCYNGQCKPFNCGGEMFVRQHGHVMSSSSTNVYNGVVADNSTDNLSHDYEESEFRGSTDGTTANCGTVSAFYKLINIDLTTPANLEHYHHQNNDPIELSYRLVTVRPKNNSGVSKQHEQQQSFGNNLNSLVPNHQHNPTSTTTSSNFSPFNSGSTLVPAEFGGRGNNFGTQTSQSPPSPASLTSTTYTGKVPSAPNSFQSYQSSGMPNRHGSNLVPSGHLYRTQTSNWSDWTPVTECQYSTACITTGRGFRLVTRECQRQTCAGRREALQVCEEITTNDDKSGQDPALYDLYEQYCPATKRHSSNQYAAQICLKYQIKYPSLLSGNGRQLLGNKNSGCIVACEDRVWKDIHYQMDAFEDGKFPFGTDCSSNGQTGYCLNGKCIHFDSHSISFDTPESVLYRSEILQLFAPETATSGGSGSMLNQRSPPNQPELLLFNAADVSPRSRSDVADPNDPTSSRLYSTISNELYKRATIGKHQSSPMLNVANFERTFMPPLQPPLPVPAPMYPSTPSQPMMYPYPVPPPPNTMTMIPGGDQQFGSQFGTRLMENNNFVPPQLNRRYKRDTNDFYGPIFLGGGVRSTGSIGASESSPTRKRFSLSSAKVAQSSSVSQPPPPPSPPTNLYRKATIQESADPEEDYVSWQLTTTSSRGNYHNRNHRNHRRRGTNIGTTGRTSTTNANAKPKSSTINWRPIKKSLRPINLSENNGGGSSRVVRFPLENGAATLIGSKKRTSGDQSPTDGNDNGNHFRTFTLVKHRQGNRLNLSANRNFKQIALPLKNHTKFLDDEDGEDENDNSDTTKSKETKKPETETNINNNSTLNQNSQIEMKKKKVVFSLGHESWPQQTDSMFGNDYRPNNQDERDEEDEEDDKETEIRVEPYVWSVILSECSRHCGQGIRTVRVVCTVGQKTIDSRLCEQELKPVHQPIEPCKERDCIGTWRAEPWSQCSAKCGRNSYQSRTIICVGPAGASSRIQKRQISPEIESDDDDETLMDDNGGNDSSAAAVAATTTTPLFPQITTESSISDLESIPTTTGATVVDTTHGPSGPQIIVLSGPQTQAKQKSAPPFPPPSLSSQGPTTTRVFSILSHNYCDLDTKPVQWRSCHVTNCDQA